MQHNKSQADAVTTLDDLPCYPLLLNFWLFDCVVFTQLHPCQPSSFARVSSPLLLGKGFSVCVCVSHALAFRRPYYLPQPGAQQQHPPDGWMDGWMGNLSSSVGFSLPRLTGRKVNTAAHSPVGFDR